MIAHWLEFVWRVAAAPTMLVSGVRKIAQDQYLHLPYEALKESKLRYTDICYTKAKGAQLNRNYWNEAEVSAAFEKLASRTTKPHTSVSIQLQAQEKDSRSQGFCMQNMVITQAGDQCTVDVYYRSTEVIQKFLADLIFFSEKLPALFTDIEPTIIRFRFANTYLSAVFMPILLRYEPNHLAFFKHLEEHDPRFYRTCGLATRRFFNESHNYTYRTRVKMFDYWKEYVTEDRKLEKRLTALKGPVPEDDDEE